jgi:hypothetical protein
MPFAKAMSAIISQAEPSAPVSTINMPFAFFATASAKDFSTLPTPLTSIQNTSMPRERATDSSA